MIRQAIDNGHRHRDDSRLRTTRPELRQRTYKWNPTLAARAALMWRSSGYRHLPTPEEVANIDPSWQEEVMLWDGVADFHQAPYEREKDAEKKYGGNNR